MFAFQWGFLHIFNDVSYIRDNIVLSSIYQNLDVNFEGMFRTITNGKYWIVGEHAFNNSQDIVLTPNTNTSMTNIVAEGVMMKEEPNPCPKTWKFLSWWRNHRLLTFVILLMKMTLPFLMLLSLFSWILNLSKSSFYKRLLSPTLLICWNLLTPQAYFELKSLY